MTAIFAHDHRFIRFKDAVFTNGKLPYSAFERYLNIFEKVVIVARSEALGQRDASILTRSDGRGVSFEFVDSLSSVNGLIFRRTYVRDRVRAVIESCDVVIVRLPSELGLLAGALGLECGKSVAVEVAGCAWDSLWNYGTLSAKIYAPIYYIRSKSLIKKANFVSYVTERFLQERYPCDTLLSTACSNVQINDVDREVLVRRLMRLGSMNNRKVIIGMIGGVDVRYKGLGVALESLAMVRKDMPPFELRICGAGNPNVWQQKALSLGIDKVVKFAGVIPAGDEVAAWLDEVDIYIQPSLTEGLPRSLIEAMSRACPALGSSAGGIPELLSLECLHKPGDRYSFGRSLVSLSSNVERCKELAIRNFEKASRYGESVLERRRQEFWSMVRKHAEEKRPLRRQGR